jgi:ABC-2 type transport system permease protein
LRRVLKLAKKEFIQLLRDRQLLPVVFVLPIVQLILFGYVVRTEIKNIATIVVDHDKTIESRRLIKDFTNAGYFTIVEESNKEKRIITALDSEQASFALIIPKGYQAALKAGKTVEVMLILDGSDSNAAAQVQSFASRIVAARSTSLLVKKLERLKGVATKVASVESRIRVWYNPDLKSVDYMVPGLIGFILTLLTTILTSTAIVREKERGTLEQLIVTPIKRWELILGKVLPFATLGFLEVVVVIFVGVIWFKIPLRGSLFLLLLLCGIFLFATVGQGLLISTLARTLHEAQVTVWFFMLPSLLLSGFIFPIENMPRFIQLLTYLIPLRYFLVMVRGVFLKGVGLAVLWDQVLILLSFGIIIFILSILRFQKKLAD